MVTVTKICGAIYEESEHGLGTWGQGDNTESLRASKGWRLAHQPQWESVDGVPTHGKTVCF